MNTVRSLTDPPTSCPVRPDDPAAITPGTNTAKAAGVRPVGIESMTSRFTTACWRVFWTSTRGDCPDTVTVSSTVPTRSSALTVAVTPAERSIPSRLIVLKPASVKVTA